MKKLIFFFVVLVIAVILGITMHRHSGYVLINIAHTQIETTVWVALFAALIFFFVFYGLIRLLRGLFHIPSRYRNWSALSHERKSYQLLRTGICELLQGEWRDAEMALGRAIRKYPAYLVNYLGAAKAAHERRAFIRRDDYLQRAKKVASKAEVVSVGIVQASWQLESGQFDAALTTLQELQKFVPHNPVVLRGLKDAYLGLDRWQELETLLPMLSKSEALTTEELRRLERLVYVALLQQASAAADANSVEDIWQKIPKTSQSDPELLSKYVQYLLIQQEFEKAENLLKRHLRKCLSRSLLDCYAQVNSDDPARQLARAEEWLVAHPENVDLLYCLGQLCARHRLWGKARNYLERSLVIRPQSEGYQLLGNVLENLGDVQGALNCYRAAI